MSANLGSRFINGTTTPSLVSLTLTSVLKMIRAAGLAYLFYMVISLKNISQVLSVKILSDIRIIYLFLSFQSIVSNYLSLSVQVSFDCHQTWCSLWSRKKRVMCYVYRYMVLVGGVRGEICVGYVTEDRFWEFDGGIEFPSPFIPSHAVWCDVRCVMSGTYREQTAGACLVPPRRLDG